MSPTARTGRETPASPSRPDLPDLKEQLAALSRAAVNYVERATGCKLDGSEESLAFVDHYLDEVRKGTPPKPEVLRLIAAALGAYLGELAIRHFGGRWLVLPPAKANDEDEHGDEADESEPVAAWRVELEAAPLRIDPVGMAAAALLRPEKDDIDAFVLSPGYRHLYEPLQAALGRMAPVTGDYYYSLTGRFETLIYVADLLATLVEQAERTADGDDGDASSFPQPD